MTKDKAKKNSVEIAAAREGAVVQRTFWERNKLTHGYLLQKKIGGVGISIVRAILLFGLCFLILQPVLNKISVSFMTEDDVYNPIVFRSRCIRLLKITRSQQRSWNMPRALPHP